MTYTLRLETGDTDGGDAASPLQRREAEQRFRQALEEGLGDAALVAPIYRAYLRIVAMHGDDPAPEALSDAEREILTQWQAAESAAVTAAFGPNRYLDQARFEIILQPA
ncbi:hypothetical protein RD110_12175 [Rhodoferax koreense]|uniref:Uncharacterized protein n=1 Tax=Rhodoferax koreensis TaxID=1842727 RepID=A0A1P8JW03_9BURK|nr:hypothetical protein [Rhodoferax koreense]APW37861.1 hypothetical protein RD110_12175 [Rhodoferax koreense]